METALKFFGSLFHPIQITVLRFFIGGFMLLPLARAALKTHGAVLTKKDYLFFAKAGFIGVFVSMIFYQLAVVYGKAAVSGVLFSCNPIFVAVWAHFLLHETIDRYVISSLVLSAVGILSIVNPFHFRGTYLSVILLATRRNLPKLGPVTSLPGPKAVPLSLRGFLPSRWNIRA